MNTLADTGQTGSQGCLGGKQHGKPGLPGVYPGGRQRFQSSSLAEKTLQKAIGDLQQSARLAS